MLLWYLLNVWAINEYDSIDMLLAKLQDMAVICESLCLCV